MDIGVEAAVRGVGGKYHFVVLMLAVLNGDDEAVAILWKLADVKDLHHTGDDPCSRIAPLTTWEILATFIRLRFDVAADDFECSERIDNRALLPTEPDPKIRDELAIAK